MARAGVINSLLKMTFSPVGPTLPADILPCRSYITGWTFSPVVSRFPQILRRFSPVVSITVLDSPLSFRDSRVEIPASIPDSRFEIPVNFRFPLRFPCTFSPVVSITGFWTILVCLCPWLLIKNQGFWAILIGHCPSVLVKNQGFWAFLVGYCPWFLVKKNKDFEWFW